ncbi:MAG: YHYH domain-containing protein [Lentilitoribacter sp.]
MKTISSLMVIAFLTSIFAMTAANAHGGRTNSEGCHNKRKDNTYHCH